MSRLLEDVYQYRLLVARRDEIGRPLLDTEQAWLQQLEQRLPTRIPACGEPGDTRVAPTLTVEFVAAGRLSTGVLQNISALGMSIDTQDPPPLGQTVVIRVVERQHGLEYVFGGRVLRRVLKGRTQMAVSFEGMPTQARLGAGASGEWQRAADSASPAPKRRKGGVNE